MAHDGVQRNAMSERTHSYALLGNQLPGGTPPVPAASPDELLRQGYSQQQVDAITVQQHQQEFFGVYIALWGTFVICSLCLLIPSTIGVFVWMMLEWKHAREQPDRCDAWLIEWTNVIPVLLLYNLFLHRCIITYVCGYNPEQEMQETGVPPPPPARVKFYSLLFPLFNFAWQIVGLVLASRSKTCGDIMPGLRNAIMTYCSLSIFMAVFMLVNTIGLVNVARYMAQNGMLNLNEAAPKGTLEKLPIVSHEELGEDAQCSICLEDFGPSKEIRKTPCGHSFHAECLGNWLNVNRKCPLCRKDVTEPSEPSDTV
eukprot:TRINITY_DN99452_c0_g1_i1.p1 TRINITY_DN99452_c0_g1~~TRINITY_DN99452_c0_g1_i1.p1  ORF type:complete len:313 (+),score=52.53 TRINITY_DN99452_c0_g1_i1:63-1001(+)